MTDNEIIKALEGCHCDTLELALDLIKRQRAKIEELSEVLSDHIRMEYAKIRAEAITEFAERLIQETRTFSEYDEGGWECDVSAISAENIDRIAKEITEGDNGE